MNKIMTFGLGMLVGAFGAIYSEVTQARKSSLIEEYDDYDVSTIITDLKDGNYFVRSYFKAKENK